MKAVAAGATAAVTTIAETINAVKVLTNCRTLKEASALLGATMPLGFFHSLVTVTGPHT